MSNPSPRRNGRTIQIAVRVPLKMHEWLSARGEIAPQIVAALRTFQESVEREERIERLIRVEIGRTYYP